MRTIRQMELQARVMLNYLLVISSKDASGWKKDFCMLFTELFTSFNISALSANMKFLKVMSFSILHHESIRRAAKFGSSPAHRNPYHIATCLAWNFQIVCGYSEPAPKHATLAILSISLIYRIDPWTVSMSQFNSLSWWCTLAWLCFWTLGVSLVDSFHTSNFRTQKCYSNSADLFPS